MKEAESEWKYKLRINVALIGKTKNIPKRKQNESMFHWIGLNTLKMTHRGQLLATLKFPSRPE